jgi:hypothetical protein
MATPDEIAEGIRLFQAELDRTAPQIEKVLNEPLPGEVRPPLHDPMNPIMDEISPNPPAPAVTPLNVYNIRQAVLDMPSNKARVEQGEQPLVPHGVANDNLAVIEGPSGILVYCSEGVGRMHQSLDDQFEVDLSPDDTVEPDGTRRFCIFPTHTIKLTLAQIKEHGVLSQVEAKDYVRKHNARLEQNFRILLEYIGKIGLNPADYYKGGR